MLFRSGGVVLCVPGKVLSVEGTEGNNWCPSLRNSQPEAQSANCGPRAKSDPPDFADKATPVYIWLVGALVLQECVAQTL